MISIINGLDVDRMRVSRHAIRRARERYNRANDKDAEGYIRGILRRAEFVGETLDDEGNHAYMFAHGRHAFIVSLDHKTILSIQRFESITYGPLKEKVRDLHAKEYRKLDRRERAMRRRFELIKAEADVEIAQLRLTALKTRSEARRLACQARINAINEYINDLKTEIKTVADEKRHVARSQVSVM
ncbi:hypothetical protein [Melghirimyces algeriensis]|uniref:Uncharacterized protein n=1 Tax=Melghirimyces algeriensis TaxID=910412 RepID=A0A521F7S0_9BACL|nr:hypothetical protein [Melghirimyces algeriensis]SMO92232.1 hypothetical protein SAMN06264849_11445 [Melghirimyces algeriensis]